MCIRDRDTKKMADLLEKIEVKNNPLQRPPTSTAKQGIGAIRRYFQEIARAGEAVVGLDVVMEFDGARGAKRSTSWSRPYTSPATDPR